MTTLRTAMARRSDALPYLDTSIRQLEASVGATNPKTLQVRSLRAVTLAKIGRMADSEREFAALSQADFKGEDLALHHVHEAIFRGLQHRHDEAIALTRSALVELQGSLSVILVAEANETLGEALIAAQRRSEAVAPLQVAMDIYPKTELVVSARQQETSAALRTLLKSHLRTFACASCDGNRYQKI